MLLFLEIILTVSAWKKGWRGWSLLPLVIGFFLAIGAGAVLGGAGLNWDEAIFLLLPLDIAVIICLAIMVAKRRNREQKAIPINENSAIIVSRASNSPTAGSMPGEKAVLQTKP